MLVGPVCTWRPFDADPFDSEQGLRVVFGMRLCTATTCVGVSVVAGPTGVDDGQPLGVQLVGPCDREDVCLDAARALGSRFGILGPVRQP
ncbi:hypothetical protein [Amycolatopsis sp. NPDC052450]|uniref:hypothetical protein n=1 Tax=Amycolatopsis sp. NPDC052450 TaxID=3363937 RepID=UPI0037CAF864